MKLTKIEKKILAQGLAKDGIEFIDFRSNYKTKECINSTIDRFLALGLIEIGMPNKFKINKELILEELK